MSLTVRRYTLGIYTAGDHSIRHAWNYCGSDPFGKLMTLKSRKQVKMYNNIRAREPDIDTSTPAMSADVKEGFKVDIEAHEVVGVHVETSRHAVEPDGKSMNRANDSDKVPMKARREQ